MILLLLLCLASAASARPNCFYQLPTRLEMQSRAMLQPTVGESLGHHDRLRRSAATSHPLNIAAFYEDSFNRQTNSAELKSKIVDKAISFWQSVLRIKTTPTKIRLSRHCNSVNVTYISGAGLTHPQYYCTDGCNAQTKCGHTLVPEAHLDFCREMKDGSPVSSGSQGVGVDADFILYISAEPSTSCNNNNGILGYAAHCQQEQALDRPIAGYINFCPGKLSTALGYFQQSLFTAQHEILHALGFAVSLFAYFRDASGQPLTARRSSSNLPALGYRSSYIFQWSSNITVNRTLSWRTRSGLLSKPVTLLVTPNVVREAREHFNCPTLEGVELEDQGEVGVALTHWEKRLLENELMTGTYTHEHVISRLTLAFMQDTGWYDVDYSQAQPLAWGKNLGCSFVTKSCLAWMNEHPTNPAPFCRRLDKSGSGIATTSCTVSRRSVGYCVLDEYSAALPPLYQYFSSLPGVAAAQLGRYGGGVYLADYCPFVQGFNWRSGSAVTRTTDCSNAANNGVLTHKTNTGLQLHGSSSICIDTNSGWRVWWCAVSSSLRTFGSGCYEYECSAEYGLILKVNAQSYQCLSGGQVLNVSITSKYFLHRGGLVCPSCADLCGSNCPSSPRRLAPPIQDGGIPCRAANSLGGPLVDFFLSLTLSLLVLL